MVDIMDYSDKENRFFDSMVLPKRVIQTGKLAYALVKKFKLKKALYIGDDGWFVSLCMARAGAWVVMVDKKKSDPAQWGVLNCYQDKVFKVVQDAVTYLRGRQSCWDIVYNENETVSEYIRDKWQGFLLYRRNNVVTLSMKYEKN